jgi:hypothetical protein
MPHALLQIRRNAPSRKDVCLCDSSLQKKPKSRTIYHSLIIMYICFLSIKLSPKRICLIGRNSPKILPISLFFIINWDPTLHTNPSTITHSSATFSELVYSRGEQKKIKKSVKLKKLENIIEKIKL